jgi:tRNA (mo5U34)-methyltransferase
MTTERSDLAARVADLDWYHTIDLPGGVVTRGLFDHRGVLDRYRLPPDLSGKRVLDVGTFDGFFAFEFERRGAEVVGIDVPNRESLDWPAPLRRTAWESFSPRRDNFDVAKSALGSRVRHEYVSVYDVTAERLGHFDFVFVGSVLIHLRDPVSALMSLREVCNDRIHVVEATHRGLDQLFRRTPAAKFQAISPHLTWWIPNQRCLSHWLEAAGFFDVRAGGTFVLPFGRQRGGVRHSVVCAQAGQSADDD